MWSLIIYNAIKTPAPRMTISCMLVLCLHTIIHVHTHTWEISIVACTRTVQKVQAEVAAGVVCTSNIASAIQGSRVLVLCCRAHHLVNQVFRSSASDHVLISFIRRRSRCLCKWDVSEIQRSRIQLCKICASVLLTYFDSRWYCYWVYFNFPGSR